MRQHAAKEQENQLQTALRWLADETSQRICLAAQHQHISKRIAQTFLSQESQCGCKGLNARPSALYPLRSTRSSHWPEPWAFDVRAVHRVMTISCQAMPPWSESEGRWYWNPKREYSPTCRSLHIRWMVFLSSARICSTKVCIKVVA